MEDEAVEVMEEAPVKKRAPKPTTLRIQKIPGGLAKVVNSAGGTPPLEFKGLFTDMTRLTAAVDAHNQGK